MYCPDCGFLNREGARFCAACKSPLDASTAAWRGPLQPGELIDDGRYRVVRPLGKGGMGAVYLAENLQAFGREVVVKEMLDYYDPTDPDQAQRARKRFELEARTLAALKHPAVPDIYGYFSQGGSNYLVMEYIVGENLETGVTHRDGEGKPVPALPYSQEQIVLFGIQICDLLEYLAKRANPDTGEPQSVIHNDIKPANIIRDPETDRVWLVDFGAARTRFGAPPAGTPTADQASVYGTVGYAPMEQYQGESVPRSDVYALAATLYHLLTDDDPRNHPFQFEQLDRLPVNLRLAIKAALEPDVATRSTATDLKVALSKSMPDQPLVEAQPLAFPDGKTAQKLSDLPALAQEYWDYTRDILYTGDLEHWLRRSLHNPVVAEAAKRAASAPLEPDAGLDVFLRELDPSIPGGKLSLDRTSVDLGTLATGRPGNAVVTLRNSGRGYSQGAVSSSAGWLRERDGRFGVKPGATDELAVEADTGSLTPGEEYRETLTLTPADGSSLLRVEVTIAVAEARVTVNPVQLTIDLANESAAVQQINLTNTGGNKVECALTRDEQWLLVHPKQLTLPAGQGATATVTVRPDRLPPLARPRGQLTVTPSHGPATTVQVQVVTRRRPAAGRAVRALLIISLLGVVSVGAWSRLSTGRLSLPDLLAEPTPIDLTADELDAAMVPAADFTVDRFETTNLQYSRYDASHRFAESGRMLPVVNVTWEEAKAYCQWAGKSLPTEEQWELVARGPENWTYPWGNQADSLALNSENNRETNGLIRVDSLPRGATPSGVLNLLGNASEWVIGSPEHPRTHRGGSFQDFGLTNSAQFYSDAPGWFRDTVGFRCIRPSPSGQ